MKEEINFSCIDYKNQIKVPDVFDFNTSRQYVAWGENNDAPTIFWENYLKNSNLQAIVNTMMDYIIGDGIDSNFNISNEKGDNFEDILKKCIFDYILFGGFCLEGIRNSDKQIVRLNYINVMDVRVDEDLTTAFISNNWNKWTPKNVIKLPLFKSDKKQAHFLFYFRGNITRNINPIPCYVSALKSIEILNNTRTFHLRNLENNFTSSVLISLNGTSIKSEELKKIKQSLEAENTGYENAGKILLINNANAEGSVTVERLQADNAGDLYQQLAESSIDDIYSAFRINKVLIGANIPTGFSKVEYENIYAIYKATVIVPMQNTIKKVLKQLDVEIEFKPFKIEFTNE